ncbi:hypothetical protein [Mucilaginibacter sp. CSA2-8R]|uniref:hypothetical protein n=1 Tax=Mucilaginibacter sp. CSA2-8R TaxID=3141542 RepID=UPI00315D1E6F
MSKRLDLIISDDVAYLPGIRAGVFMGAGPMPAVRPSEPKIELLNNITPYASWGDDNLFPQNIIEMSSRSTELPSLLEWKARAALGKEVLPFTRSYDAATGTLKDEFCNDPKILAFLSSIPTKRYMREAYNDFFWFWNVFPDLIKSKGGDEIAYIGVNEAAHCRWSVQNDKGIIEKCWISPNWGTGMVKEDNALILPVIDPYNWNAVEDIKKNTSNRFVYPISFPSPGKTYYQLSTWDGFRTSGWMAIAEKIPVFKQHLMKNQMHIKYLITIPSNHWENHYEGWHNKSEEEQMQLKRKTLTEINDRLTNVENAGKSIMNEVSIDAEGKVQPGWKIEVIDDKFKEGAYLEDSQEASAHLMRALGLDPTLVGQGPGKNMGAGSGSDKRIAFNLYCALQNPYRDVVLEPFHFIADYNGWKEKYPTLTFKTVEVELETLDKSHQTSQLKAA